MPKDVNEEVEVTEDLAGIDERSTDELLFAEVNAISEDLQTILELFGREGNKLRHTTTSMLNATIEREKELLTEVVIIQKDALKELVDSMKDVLGIEGDDE